MPTKEQIEITTEHIKDVIGRRYIEGDGDMCSCVFQPEGGGPVGVTVFQGIPTGTPEPFVDLPSWGKVELLVTYVGWKGFSDSERSLVLQRVVDGEISDLLMDGIEATKSPDDGREQFKAILAGDSCKKYEQFLTTSTELALDRMQRKGGIEI